jgi:hypothetical protein
MVAEMFMQDGLGHSAFDAPIFRHCLGCALRYSPQASSDMA